MSVEEDQEILHLFRAAVPIKEIRDRYRHRNVAQTEAAIRRAMETNSKERARIDQRLLEVERVEALYRATYPQALKGDTKAVDACMRLSGERARLLDDGGPASGLTAAFEESLADLDTRDADSAVIEAGRATAKQIDEALEHGTAYERTKALYLLPHLMNVLRELGATPASRESLRAKAHASGGGKLEALQRGVGLAVARETGTD